MVKSAMLVSLDMASYLGWRRWPGTTILPFWYLFANCIFIICDILICKKSNTYQTMKLGCSTACETTHLSWTWLPDWTWMSWLPKIRTRGTVNSKQLHIPDQTVSDVVSLRGSFTLRDETM